MPFDRTPRGLVPRKRTPKQVLAELHRYFRQQHVEGRYTAVIQDRRIVAQRVERHPADVAFLAMGADERMSRPKLHQSAGYTLGRAEQRVVRFDLLGRDVGTAFGRLLLDPPSGRRPLGMGEVSLDEG